MDQQVKKYSDITAEKITEWKARYGADSLSEVTVVTGEDKSARFVIRKPNRSLMDAVAQHGISKNVTAANKVMINSCVLGGDMDDMERDGGVYTALLKEIESTLERYDSTVKKL